MGVRYRTDGSELHRYLGRVHRILMLSALLATTIVGIAQASPPVADASRLYAPCVVCHQPRAWGSADGNIPSLAGQHRRYLERQLATFRSGARDDTAMQIVAVHSEFKDPNNMLAVAGYLSGLEANPNPVKGSGKQLRMGQEMYAHICAACHGSDGLGQSDARAPRIAGQHYPYLKRQIESAADLHRVLAPPEMTSALRGMSAPEKDALADYISRLGSSEGAGTDSLAAPP